ncbi:MAG: tetratricopeptide repeat protein [Treponema sp.]|jgi:tetratricopeptide (TPR) repeat protein|nr:tetratricopeptide repeat protein [Treponema sp.]
MAKEQEALESGDRIALFIQRRRKPLLGIVIFLGVFLVAAAAYFSIREALQKRAIVTLEELETRLTALESAGTEAGTGTAETDALLEELEGLGRSSFGYAAARAYSLRGGVYAARGEWQKAEEAYTASAEKGANTYLAPLSLYNAAVAAEERGNLDGAIAYYRRSLDFRGDSPAVYRAWFNTARIYEAKKDVSSAEEAYRSLLEKAPAESAWAKLAQSRLIALDLAD